MTSVLGAPPLEALLESLHRRSDDQAAAIGDHFERRAAAGELSWDGMDDRSLEFLSDKFVALDRDKAAFCYQLCRSLDARRIVEVGTSFGVSTLYLAAAVRDNGGGTVIATENQPGKVAAARANFQAAGLAAFIDLREGDLRETLREIDGEVDFALIDIWTEMARPALELIAPRLSRRAVVICDNTTRVRHAYGDYFAFVEAPRNGLRTLTLPFDGGLEMTVRCD